jgi:hypothetical protein
MGPLLGSEFETARKRLAVFSVLEYSEPQQYINLASASTHFLAFALHFTFALFSLALAHTGMFCAHSMPTSL